MLTGTEHVPLRSLEPRRILRWVYVGRLSLASAIFIAAVWVWRRADSDALLIASLAFSLSLVATVISAAYSDVYGRRLTETFRYAQAIFDTCLVTAVVHVTNGSTSQFAALYILVIAVATLMLPAGGGLLIAALGNVLYVGDIIWLSQLNGAVWLQMGVFAIVALGSAYVSAQLRRAGAGREELAAELAQARLQADEILRHIRSGILTIDADGRLLYANPTAEHLLGVDLLEELGRPILERIAGVAPELSRALHRSVSDRVRITRAEGTVVQVSRRFPIGVTTTYVDGDERTPRTATAIFSDISDQKRLEALRLRAERLEGVAELSASLAHEIKNPLASIRSAVEQLSRRQHATDDERTLGALVLRESDRLSRLLSEFLDFARVQVVQTAPVDLGVIARGAASLAATNPDAAPGVNVSCVVPERVTLTVEGDEDLLHRAVFNLVLNAVQASPAEGEVRIEVTPGTFEPLGSGEADLAPCISLRVTDQGPGIAPELRDRLFDPFFTTKPGGSGLGLAVVHRAIEAHRGLVFVEDATPGARFTIVIPTQRAAVAAPSSYPAPGLASPARLTT